MEAQFYLFFFIINYSVWPVSAPWLTVDIAKSMDLACCKGSVFLCDWLASYCAGSHCEWCPLSISTMRGRSFLKRYLVMHSLALTLHLRMVLWEMYGRFVVCSLSGSTGFPYPGIVEERCVGMLAYIIWSSTCVLH